MTIFTIQNLHSSQKIDVRAGSLAIQNGFRYHTPINCVPVRPFARICPKKPAYIVQNRGRGQVGSYPARLYRNHANS